MSVFEREGKLVSAGRKTYEVVFELDCDCDDERRCWSDDVPDWMCLDCKILQWEPWCDYCGKRCRKHVARRPYCTGCGKEVHERLIPVDIDAVLERLENTVYAVSSAVNSYIYPWPTDENGTPERRQLAEQLVLLQDDLRRLRPALERSVSPST
jgi:hypothetical protein